MKRITSRYRAIEDDSGELLPEFFDEKGEPVACGLLSVTYCPDYVIVYEETEKTRFVKLIEGKIIKTDEISLSSMDVSR